MSDDPRITVTPIVVRSTDMDASRHVNNAVYFQYCEQGRIHHLRRLGVMDKRRRPGPDSTGGIVVGEARCRFIASAVYGDVLDVETRTREVRDKVFVLSYRITRQGDNALIAEGDSTVVWLGPNGRAAPMPDDVRQALVASIVAEEPSGVS